MKLGRIVGKVWGTIKDPQLQGIKLAIMQPVDENEVPLGNPVVAADLIGVREQDLVFWVSSAEATFPLENMQIPSDVSIVGLVDRLDL